MEFAGTAGETLDTCLWTFLLEIEVSLSLKVVTLRVLNCQYYGNSNNLKGNTRVCEKVALAVSNIADNRNPCTTVRTNNRQQTWYNLDTTINRILKSLLSVKHIRCLPAEL